jgi:nucleotide-binding universal stress UspA family protein
MTLKTIVSVVESPAAANDVALAKALSLARWYESGLHVVHVSPSSAGDEGIHNTLVEHITAAVDESGARGVSITPAVLSGSPATAIADYAERVDADLVVVEKKPRRSKGYWSTGSFAAALGTAIKAPTMAVSSTPAQPAETGAPFRNILSAIDFSAASLRALKQALALAQQSGGRLTLLHVLNGFPYQSVYSAPDAFHLMRDLRAQGAKVNRELQMLIPPDALNWSDIDVSTAYGETGTAIAEAAAERRSDLIVLGLPERRKLKQLLAGSTAHKVLRRAQSPVLLVPGPETFVPYRGREEHGEQWRHFRVFEREGDNLNAAHRIVRAGRSERDDRSVA